MRFKRQCCVYMDLLEPVRYLRAASILSRSNELELMLNGESQTDIEAILDRANWIVISLTDVSNGQINLLQRFFSERPNLIRDKKVILFSFHCSLLSRCNRYFQTDGLLCTL